MQATIFFKSLSDQTRFELIMLMQHHKTLCVCDFTDLLDLSQPKISRHLAHLREIGIVSTFKKGRWVYYSISTELPAWCQTVIGETFKANSMGLKPLLEKQITMDSCCE